MQTGLLILIQFLIFQNVCSKGLIQGDTDSDVLQTGLNEGTVLKNYMVVEYKEDRSIADIWNNIKKSAINAWNALKNLVKNTKEKIKVWVKNVKERAAVIAKSFGERVKTLVSKIKGIIQNIIEDENIKKCFQDQNETINKMLVDIVQHVTTCISQKISSLTALEDYKKLDTMLNDTKFMEEIEARLNQCQKSKQDTEECFQKVREDILNETEAKEADVLKSRTLSRNFADDILDAVITCSTDGMIEASAVITNIIVNIIKCITQVPQ